MTVTAASCCTAAALLTGGAVALAHPLPRSPSPYLPGVGEIAFPSVTADRCAAALDRVAAERSRPGILLDMAREALLACRSAGAAAPLTASR